MIHVLVVRDDGFGGDTWLAAPEGDALRDRFRLWYYDELVERSSLPRGCWVFSATDHLSPTERSLAVQAADMLERAGQTVLNHPARALSRPALLDRLHAAGVNDFRAFRPEDLPDDLHYPVFVREAVGHTGSLTDLLHDAGALEQELGKFMARSFRVRDLLVVEFCDVADPDGLYRKYSAFCVGDAIHARHLHFARDWMVKAWAGVNDPERGDEERRYMIDNPHADELRRVFELSGIEYGRADYSVSDGGLRIFEVNTNPTVGMPPGPPRAWTEEELRYRDRMLSGRATFFERFERAWLDLDRGDDGPPIPIAFSRSLVRRAKAEARRLRWSDRRRAWVGRLSDAPVLRPLRGIADRSLRRLSLMKLRIRRARRSDRR